MCEPAHSIVQYDPFNDDRFGGTLDVSTVLSKMGNWAKKIGKWFHISKMGAGHSKATMHGARQWEYLPRPINYEGFWWKKDFDLDGASRRVIDDMQFDAAYQYHLRACMGDMQTFRRFLEASMRASNSPTMYATYFQEYVLTGTGKDQLRSKLKLAFPRMRQLIGVQRERYIKLIMGFTRKRGLLIPEWSMDDAFWSGRRTEC